MIRNRALFTLGLSLLPALAGASVPLRAGMPVEVDVERGPDDRLVADDVTLLEEPRSAELRGEVRAVDPEGEWIQVLVWRFWIEDDLELVGAASVTDIEVGRVVELDVEHDGERLTTDEIDADTGKTSWKVKGAISRVVGDADFPLAVEVAGLRIDFVEGTDIDTNEDPIEEDLFRVLREEDGLLETVGRTRATGPLVWTGSLRHNYLREQDLELREGAERDLSEPSLRIELLGRDLAGFQLFSQLTWTGRYAVRERNLAPATDEHDFAVRQLYVSRRTIGDFPLGFVIGKQRMQDDREFLFDDYLDAARVFFHGWRPLVLEVSHMRPVAPISDKSETWNDWFVQSRLYLGEDWKLRAFGLWRDDTDARNRDSVYRGVGLHGRQGPLKLWFDGVHLGGEDKGQRQDAWAVSTGLGLRARDLPWRPSFWLGWSVGSGDEDPDDDVSNAFRQTGYEDNSSRVWGVSNILHYGELLDPELSNLRVLSLGFTVRPVNDVSIELVGHRYALDTLDDEFDVTDLRLGEEPLDGVSRGLGHEVDVIVAWRNAIEGLHVVGKVGRFTPGEAFGDRASEAWLQRLELRWDF